MAFIGSFLSLTVSAVLPCVCYLKLSGRWAARWERVACGTVIVVAGVSAVLGTYASVQGIMSSLSGEDDTSPAAAPSVGCKANSNCKYWAYFPGRGRYSKLYDAGTRPQVCYGASEWNTKASPEWINGKLCGK
eukprot:jgi/Chlat1/3426/Chrsp23S03763